MSMRARWFWAGVVFYLLMVGLLVIPELNEDHLNMERAFRDQMKGLAALAADELADEPPPLDGPEARDRLEKSLRSYPGFDYAVLERDGRTMWTVLGVSAAQRAKKEGWTVPASGGPMGSVIEIEPRPGGWLHLAGHLLEVSVPVGNKAAPGLSLRLGMSTATLNSTLAAHVWIAGAMIAFTSLLGIVMVAGMNRSIRRRVEQLIAATMGLSEGPGRRVEIRTGDELEQLGDSFNAMAERLEEREAELRSVQQTLRSVLDCINAGISYISRDYRVVMANKFQGGIFGRDPSSFQGRQCFEEFEKREEMCVHCPGALAMADGEPHSVETEAVLDDGRRAQVLINAYPVKDSSGEVTGFVEHVEDVTRWKEMEEALKDHGQKLEQMVEERTRDLVETQEQLLQSAKLASLGQMVGGVAHEINNPIAIMVTRLELLMSEMQGEIPAEFARDLGVLLKQARRIGGITSQLLAFSRMSSPNKLMAPLPPVLEEAASMVESQFARRGIEIKRRIEPDPPESLMDRGRLLQVFLNLLNNAADAITGKGSIVIGCSVRGRDGKQWIEVSFEDSGPGVPAGIRDRIFDPFFTTKEVGKGTGLGLSVSYGIVSDHGGVISVTDGEGGGARFEVRLPVIEADEEPTAEEEVA